MEELMPQSQAIAMYPVDKAQSLIWGLQSHSINKIKQLKPERGTTVAINKDDSINECEKAKTASRDRQPIIRLYLEEDMVDAELNILERLTSAPPRRRVVHIRFQELQHLLVDALKPGWRRHCFPPRIPPGETGRDSSSKLWHGIRHGYEDQHPTSERSGSPTGVHCD